MEILLLVCVIGLALLLVRQSTLMQSMQQDMRGLRDGVAQQTQSLDSRLGSTAQNLVQLSRHIADIQVSQQEITNLKKEMTSLSNLLTIPKLRGNIGELLLGDLLRTYFPEARFALQHRFRDGSTVDACLFLEDQYKLCIDAKFPLESFRRYRDTPEQPAKRAEFLRDVKKHINAIADKYLLPAEKTLDFALMYIPSEHVYYELLTHEDRDDFFTYAAQKKVLPVSPSTLFSYIQILLMGFKGMRIEEHAQHILGQMDSVRSLLAQTGEGLERSTKHLKNATSSLEDTQKVLQKSADRVEKLLHSPTEVQTLPKG